MIDGFNFVHFSKVKVSGAVSRITIKIIVSVVLIQKIVAVFEFFLNLVKPQNTVPYWLMILDMLPVRSPEQDTNLITL